MQTGVQILFALLLTVAFTGAFANADAYQRTVYVTTLLCCALAMAVLIAPVAYHRTLFQRGRKAEVVAAAHRLLRVGLAVLVAAVVGCLLLVVDEAVGRGRGVRRGRRVADGVRGAVVRHAGAVVAPGNAAADGLRPLA